jgi:hypothetical protein
MEPITLIVIKDAYKGLKALIQKRFAGKPEAEIVLAKHEEKPLVWEKPLKEALTEVGASKDETLIKAAQEILKRTDPDGAVRRKYDVDFHGKVIGAQVGDHNTMEIGAGVVQENDEEKKT